MSAIAGLSIIASPDEKESANLSEGDFLGRGGGVLIPAQLEETLFFIKLILIAFTFVLVYDNMYALSKIRFTILAKVFGK